MSVYRKLNEARAKFHALKLEKTGHNKFAGYYYFELADFLIPALRIFNEVGLCAIISFDEKMATMTIHDVDGKLSSGPMAVTTVPSEPITITSPLSEAALKGCHPVQNVGACETYARRYLWVAALEIVEHDALDATTGKDDKSVSPSKEVAKGLQPEIQDFLSKAAPRIDAAMPDISVVVERIMWVLDNYPGENRNEIKNGLWSKLSSKTRTAVKKFEDENGNIE